MFATYAAAYPTAHQVVFATLSAVCSTAQQLTFVKYTVARSNAHHSHSRHILWPVLLRPDRGLSTLIMEH